MMTGKKRARKPDRTFGQALIDSLQEFVQTAERGGPITARTVKLNLEPNRYDSEDVKAVRVAMGVSQQVFATALAVSVKTIQAWESGRQAPPPLACRFLDEINLDPRAWFKRQLEKHATQVEVRLAR